MHRLVYLDSAQRDLANIQRDVTKESGSRYVGDAFVMKLAKRCEKLASLPGTLGSPRPELRSDIRSVSHRGYVIFFRCEGDAIPIINVLGAHRDSESHFSARDDAS